MQPKHPSAKAQTIGWAVWAAGVTAIILIFSGKVQEDYDAQVNQVQQQHIAAQTLHVTSIEPGVSIKHQPNIKAWFSDDGGKQVVSRVLGVHTNIHVGDAVDGYRLDDNHFLIKQYDSGFPTSLKIFVIAIAWGVVLLVGVLAHRRENRVAPEIVT